MGAKICEQDGSICPERPFMFGGDENGISAEEWLNTEPIVMKALAGI